MTKLSLNSKRAIAGIGLVLCALCFINYYFNIGIFGRFGREALVLSFAILTALLHFSGITIKEVQEYRDRKRNENAANTDRK